MDRVLSNETSVLQLYLDLMTETDMRRELFFLYYGDRVMHEMYMKTTHWDNMTSILTQRFSSGGDRPAKPSVVPRKDTRLASLVIELVRVISVVLSPHSSSVVVEDTRTNLRDNEDIPESWSRTTDCDNTTFADYRRQQKQKE